MSIEITNAQQFISWINTKIHLNEVAPNAAKRFVKRGQVFWCHFGLNIGSEISKVTPRPAVVVSNFMINKNSSNVVVVPIRHNQNQSPYLVPFTPITDSNGDVILDGRVDTANIICISKARLGDQIASLSPVQMQDIDKGIAISLNLIHYYINEENKCGKLEQYINQIKRERNKAQDILQQIKKIVSHNDFNDKNKEKIKILLDKY